MASKRLRHLQEMNLQEGEKRHQHLHAPKGRYASKASNFTNSKHIKC